ncbi:MAG: hypothetical protein AAGB04_01940 [Pseudomonadota bacterium]
MRTSFFAGVSILALGIASASADESATTNQRGTEGGAYINQANDTDDATAIIRQGETGTGDVAATYQDGTGRARAVVNQNTGGTEGGDNLAGIVQTDGTGSAGSIAGSRAVLTQDGSSNTGGIRQQGTGNLGFLTQDGSANQAVVKQGDARNETFEILNASVPSAEEDWQELNFDFDEEKVSGHSRDTPPGGIDGFPDPDPEGIVTDSTGDIYQYGEGSKAAILQVTGDYHEAFIEQLDDGNEARALQAGYSQYASIVQEGQNNGADVRQQNGEGSGNHTAEILQSGDLNTILLDQTGTENASFFRQEGSENSAMVVQMGEYDITRVNQRGDGNSAEVYQENDDIHSTAIVRQSGGENTSVINQ